MDTLWRYLQKDITFNSTVSITVIGVIIDDYRKKRIWGIFFRKQGEFFTSKMGIPGEFHSLIRMDSLVN